VIRMRFNSSPTNASGLHGKCILSPPPQPKILRNVLDPAYVPSSPEDIAIFKLKNHFLYSVFVDHKLVTDKGKTYVRHHSNNFDAQAIYYTKMCARYTVSLAAELSTGHVLKFLTNFQRGKDKWKGKTAINFLAYYIEQLRVYDELLFNRVPPGLLLADDFKIILFDAAVQISRIYGKSALPLVP
jgi:hypothetical protein